MKRLVTPILIIALLLAVYLRSRRHLDGLVIMTPWTCVAFSSFERGVMLGIFNLDLTGGHRFVPRLFTQSVEPGDDIPAINDLRDSLDHKFDHAGLLIGSGRCESLSGNPSFAILKVPQWLAGIVAIALLWRPIRVALIQHRRRRRGLCLACGYDLRDIQSDRCPECGAHKPVTKLLPDIRSTQNA
jgi:hypothetical protein